MTDGDSRHVALGVLTGVERGGRSDRLLEAALTASELDARDRRLVTEMVYGTLRRQRQLDRTLAPCSRRRFSSLDPEVRAALRLGAYQAACLDSVPAHAAIDRTVAAVKRRSPRAAGMVNAVLRAWQREGGRLIPPGRDEAERLQVPRWLLDRFRTRHGDAGADWLSATAQPPVNSVRVAPAAGDIESVQAALAAEGVVTESSPWVGRGLRVVEGNVLNTASFRAGSVTPQSEAAQLVAALLPLPGGPVLDVCAGRGGKSLPLLAAAPAASVLALDTDRGRLESGRAAAARAGVAARARWLRADATALPLRGAFGRVLVDAPCSALGTIRRHPEVKWRVTPRQLPRYADLQQRILASAAAVTAPGGTLLYVTCSTEPEENERVVARVLEDHPWLQPFPLAPDGPAADLVGPDGVFRTAPAAPDLDGFFAVALRRAAGD